MKLKGTKVQGPNIVDIVIPRNGGQFYAFKAQAVLDDDFDQLCPKPKAPTIIKAGVGKVPDFEDVNYRRELDTYASKRMAYIVLKSLQATQDLEWETVDMANPNTWIGYETELKESGFSQPEINLIVNGFIVTGKQIGRAHV